MTSTARADFTGLWEANLGKSLLRGRPARRILVKIEHDEPRLVQTIFMSYGDGAEERLEFTYTTDGEKSMNSIRGIACETHAHWDGEELVIELPVSKAAPFAVPGAVIRLKPGRFKIFAKT